MAKNKRLTENQKLFQKEVKRIERAMKRAEKRGYTFHSYNQPEMPKRVTKQAIKKLQGIKGDTLYKFGEKIDATTGELTSGYEARKQERRESARKAVETRKANKEKKEKEKQKKKPIQEIEINVEEPPLPKIDYQPQDEYTPIEYDSFPSFTTVVIANFKAELAHFPIASEPILKWFNEMVRLYGEDEVAEMLEDAKQAGVWLDRSIWYNKEKTSSKIAEFMNYLPNMSEGIKEELIDAFEQEESWETPE